MILVVEEGSTHIDWSEAGGVRVSVWHELVEWERSAEESAATKPSKYDDKATVITIWQKSKDDVGQVVEFTHTVK